MDPITRALIDGVSAALIFLESGGPDEVNPDSAVRCMENIASSLLVLSKSDQLALRSHLEQISSGQIDQAYARFVLGLPDSIGLASQ